jgi:hypothetical protein
MSASTEQVGGAHYKDFKIQPAEFIHANGIGFLEGNAIKYVCRHRAKGGRQDIEKAIHYLQLLLEWGYKSTPADTPLADLLYHGCCNPMGPAYLAIGEPCFVCGMVERG